MSYKNKIESLFKEWKEWSEQKNWYKEFSDGWEEYFEKFDEMINLAEVILISDQEINLDCLNYIDFMFSISSESEQLKEFCIENFELVVDKIPCLIVSKNRDTRWQIYSILGNKKDQFYKNILLLASQNDVDEYCRKRALLALDTT